MYLVNSDYKQPDSVFQSAKVIRKKKIILQ